MKKLQKETNVKKQWKKPVCISISKNELTAYIKAAARSGGSCSGGFMR